MFNGTSWCKNLKELFFFCSYFSPDCS